MSLRRSLLCVALAAPGLGLAPCGEAGAQAVSDAATLDTVVVTARKREEDVQAVPFAVDVLDGRALDTRRIDDTQSLFRHAPGLSLTSFDDGRFAYFQLRGIGPLSQALSPDDGSVVTYVDGVPQPVYASEFAYLDLERIEILRGPQGTLFGRNSQGGAVHLITRQPSNAREGHARVEAGSDRYGLAQAALSGPLREDRLALGVAARASTVDGYVPNRAPGGGALGDRDVGAVRASAVLTPAGEDGARFVFAANGDRQVSRPYYYVLRGTRPQVEIDPENEVRRRAWGASLSAELPLAFATLHSITAFNGFRNAQITDDTDGLIYGPLFGLPPSAFLPRADFSDWREAEDRAYQELRLNSAAGAPWAWVVGAVYFRSDFDVDLRNRSSFSPFLNGDRDARQEIDSRALFAEATLPLGDPRWQGTLGLRHTRDDKTLHARFAGAGFPGTVDAFEERDRRRDDLTTGRVALAFAAGDALDLYATAGRGAKSGGFPRFTLNAAFGTPSSDYAASTSWTYEAGLKSRFAQGRGRANLAAFYNDVSDEQLLVLDFVSFQFLPANLDTRSYGLEFDGAFRFDARWSLAAAAAWTEAEIAQAGASGAQPGNRVPNVPRIATSLTLDYLGDARSGGVRPLATLSHQYVGRRAADVAGSFDLDAYHNLDARLGLQWPAFSLYAFGRNLGNDRQELNGALYGPGVDAAALARDRVLGVGASFQF